VGQIRKKTQYEFIAYLDHDGDYKVGNILDCCGWLHVESSVPELHPTVT
jgi:hypothetical protein